MKFITKMYWLKCVLVIFSPAAGGTDWWCELHKANHGSFLQKLPEIGYIEKCQETCLSVKNCQTAMLRLSNGVCYLVDRNWEDNNYSEDPDIHLCEIATDPCLTKKPLCASGSTCQNKQWGLYDCDSFVRATTAAPVLQMIQLYLDGDLKTCQEPVGISNSLITIPVNGRPPLRVSVYGKELQCLPLDGSVVYLATDCYSGCQEHICIPHEGSTAYREVTLCKFKCPIVWKVDHVAVRIYREPGVSTALEVCEIVLE